uniref:3-oxoacyl-[acyl-carrier protein] reductase n=1 Tax=Sphingomonas sp. JE1 TaxID=1628059 RepID=A0A0D4ZZY8_9SPHN|nr:MULTISPECIES: glucose 1-dehydrogenase [unclassified Sphingomonas]AJW29506.1 3-oxoacyl-[acyl-carrier protein] reductase [Sphingomonas sp. JE1]
MDLTGKVAIVTGGGSGMGEACAHLFVRAGASVVVADRDAVKAEAVANAISAGGGKAVGSTTDVSAENQIEAMVALAIDRFGGLDCAVNAAGIACAPSSVQDASIENWHLNLSVNLLGVALAMKHQIPAMVKRGGGSIINISSTGGLDGVPMMAPYVAAKHGVLGATKCAALENARHNIRVNAICPGLIDTAMFRNTLTEGTDWSQFITCPMGRLGEPSEIADVALWLASRRSSFVTGQAICVDGGLLVGAVHDPN